MDYSEDDSDEELGAYIYSISRTAKLLREGAAARNDELSTNNNDTISRSKRKSPPEVGNISEEPNHHAANSLLILRYAPRTEGCANNAQNGGVCRRNGSTGTICKYEDEGCHVQNSLDGPNNIIEPPVCLFIDSDTTFLDNLQNFLRTKCVEVFVATQYHLHAPSGAGGGKPSYVGQVGLRCIHCKGMPRKELARQAVSYPSRCDLILESVRNYQRTHLEACPLIPQVIKNEYKKLQSLRNARSGTRPKTHKVLKVYFAEAARELGIVDSPNHKGLVFDASSVNTSGVPSERLQTIIDAAESRSSKFALLFTPRPTIHNHNLEMRKFERVCSEATQKVLLAARKEPTVLVAPQDFPTVSDEHYLLYHQLGALRKKVQSTRQEEQYIYKCGLICKHCALENENIDILHRGVYYPADHKALVSRKLSLLVSLFI